MVESVCSRGSNQVEPRDPAASERLFEIASADLRKRSGAILPGGTIGSPLQPTSVVNELLAKLVQH
jgi:hypothetical protein